MLSLKLSPYSSAGHLLQPLGGSAPLRSPLATSLSRLCRPEFFWQLLGRLSQRAARGREVWSHFVQLERGDFAA